MASPGLDGLFLKHRAAIVIHRLQSRCLVGEVQVMARLFINLSLET